MVKLCVDMHGIAKAKSRNESLWKCNRKKSKGKDWLGKQCYELFSEELLWK